MSDPHRTLADGRYRLEGILGEGGMASVYAAWDDRLKVHRAIKLLSPVYARRADLRVRFQKEAVAMARVRHPHVLAVYDVSTDDPPFLVMDLEEGGSLAGHLAAYGAMPPRQVVEVGLQMLDGLQAAHLAGIVHRDVKPHNVLLTKDGNAKVTDFGIAQLADRTMYTHTGAVMGTLEFMAPEQYEDSSDVDVRADVYAAGATLYVLLTDRKPKDLYVRELEDRVWAEVHPMLRPILQKATRHDREQRHRDPAALARALSAVLAQLPATPATAHRLGSAGAALRVHDIGRELSEPAMTTPIPEPTEIKEAPEQPETIPAPPPVRPARRLWWLLPGAVVTTGLFGLVVGLVWTVSRPAAGTAVLTSPPEAQAEAATVVVPPAAPPSPVPVVKPPVAVPRPTPRPAHAAVSPAPVAAPVVLPVAEPVVALGTLFVNSIPPGEAYLNGESYGSVPLSVSLPVGQYEVTLKHPDWPSLTRTLAIVEGTRVPLCWDFAADGPCPRR